MISRHAPPPDVLPGELPSQDARRNMIEQQVRPWDVLDQRVLDVMSEIPREAFLAPEHRGLAFSDFELPIGHGQHMLKPVVDGRFLQALSLTPSDRVLEIGTGSGCLSACLARLAGQVQSLEIVPELSAGAGERLAALGFDNVQLQVADGARPPDTGDTFDAILFGGSIPALPERYRDRLAIGGRLVVVVGVPSFPTMDARLITRIDHDEWATESLFETSISPLANFSSASTPFVF